jgi:glucose-1-phosphate thymidylyltransferase
MKGIVLAGGRGTRLYPITKAVSKQLLPVYKYPMIYFPINTLLQMGIEDILIITTPEHQNLFKETLKDLTCANFSYIVQDSPRGLPEAFVLAEEWLEGSDVALVLGDNIIINNAPIDCLPNTVFSYKVKHPERYGVLDFDEDGRIKNIVEKPQTYISDNAMIGLYVLENSACEISKKLKPSSRGELEIVDLIKEMNKKHPVSVLELDGFWFDAGTHDDLLDCGNLVKAIEFRTNKSFDLA